ncbi:eCIS core domain-containing protein [Roseiarcus fermentans]|nr:DUF4157 domain-containing protein [Roseiarcus fermentans]
MTIVTAIPLLFLSPSKGMACGGFFDAQCNLTHGGLSPSNISTQAQQAAQDTVNTIAKAQRDVGNALNELQAGLLSGPVLEQAIISSHNTAINGAMSIPPDVRRALTGYASEDSMNRVRYKIGDNGFANLAHLIEQGGKADAVTLIDVVIFRGPIEANDLSTWAHELTHVDQYRDWGVHSFSVQYTRDWRSVEDPAYMKGNGFAAWYSQNKNGNTITNRMPTIPNTLPATYIPQPSNIQSLGAFCYTAFGRFGPGPIQAQGNPCFVTLPQGNVPGQVGP